MTGIVRFQACCLPVGRFSNYILLATKQDSSELSMVAGVVGVESDGLPVGGLRLSVMLQEKKDSPKIMLVKGQVRLKGCYRVSDSESLGIFFLVEQYRAEVIEVFPARTSPANMT